MSREYIIRRRFGVDVVEVPSEFVVDCFDGHPAVLLTTSFSKLETPDHLRNRTVQVIARNIEDIVYVGRWSRC